MAGLNISNLWKMYRVGLKHSPALMLIITGTTPAIIFQLCRILSNRELLNEKPYYRGEYCVVRPDDKVALNWRLPEEYPSPFVTNRSCYDYNDYKKDYGYKANI